MPNVSGTIRKVILDGVSYTALGDANFSEVGGAYENDAIPTSGENIRKMTRRAEKIEGVVLACNGSERALLKELSERTTDFTLAYETAAGDMFRAPGWIEFEARETEENRAAIQLHPRGTWNPFLAA